MAPPTGSASVNSVRLNNIVHVVHPVQPGFDPDSPSLVVTFGWFRAKASHVMKYAADFHRLYPTATVLVLQVDASWLTQTQATREGLLEPAADVLDGLIQKEGSRFRGVLLHAMSNGGAVQLMTFSKVLAKRVRVSDSRYPAALVLDSAPESNTLRCLIAATTVGMTNPLMKLTAIPLVVLFYSVFRVTYGLTVPMLTDVRRHVNSPNLIPAHRNPPKRQDGSSIEFPKVPASAPSLERELQWIPRLYICSNTDEVTAVEPILAHVDEARRAGFDVRSEVYDKSPHVSHARVDPERYWGAVQQLWRDASLRPTRAKL